MTPTDLSPCIITEKIDACKAFYLEHFNVTLLFDCGWYISLALNDNKPQPASIQFMSPQSPQQLTFQGQGLTYNLLVASADDFYNKLVTQNNLTPIMPLEDHPWGDRGFSIADPTGINLYIFHPIKASEEFQAAFKDPESPSSA
ncbi:VOC family protein [Poriferisphaera sp. WC338]|uniref:VOC family protein n=1 Tax=Poriferisphaera sp. WC338 TaxID=3425129 RepID=UPI003D81A2CB